MRYRQKKHLVKTTLLFLGACFVGALFLHHQTDDAMNIENNRSQCKGPWCEAPAEQPGGLAPVLNHRADNSRELDEKVRFQDEPRKEIAGHKEDDYEARVKRIVDDFRPVNDADNSINVKQSKNDAGKLLDESRDKVRSKKEKEESGGQRGGAAVNRDSGEGKPAQVAAPIDAAAAPMGPGENGRPVIADKLHLNESKKLFNINQFNLYISDMISLNRTVPDVRPVGCAALKYPKNLPKTSLIVVFHNEAWSTLWRTIHSVINRSPSCMQEVVLVDDASTQDHLKARLDQYALDLNFAIKVLHLEKRSGLTVARLKGAEVASGEILVFLDSHCEVVEGWLEPMVYRIAQDRSHVVVPVIDVIDDDTFEYMKGDGTPQIGGVSWGLIFTWQSMQTPDRVAWMKNRTIPIKSPTMAGGLFAIDKSFFYKLGRYDEGFKVWGGENLELSFKTWMCGGTLETMPCSHVGHIFRHRSPYSSGGAGNFMNSNNKRLAEVWLDQYKEFYYYFHPEVRKADAGDISERLAIRERLKCKSFAWYLENVFPETNWPTNDTVFGHIKHSESGWCLDFHGGDKDGSPVHVRQCNENSGPQLWSFTKRGEIKHDDKCLDAPTHDQVSLYTCHFGGGNQHWTYDNETQHIIHLNGRCLDYLPGIKSKMTISVCDMTSRSQQWVLDMKHWHLPAKSQTENNDT